MLPKFKDSRQIQRSEVTSEIFLEGIQTQYKAPIVIIMHPLRGPKGRGIAPTGAMRGVH